MRFVKLFTGWKLRCRAPMRVHREWRHRSRKSREFLWITVVNTRSHPHPQLNQVHRHNSQGLRKILAPMLPSQNTLIWTSHDTQGMIRRCGSIEWSGSLSTKEQQQSNEWSLLLSTSRENQTNVAAVAACARGGRNNGYLGCVWTRVRGLICFHRISKFWRNVIPYQRAWDVAGIPAWVWVIG